MKLSGFAARFLVRHDHSATAHAIRAFLVATRSCARCPSKWGAGDERGSMNHMSRQPCSPDETHQVWKLSSSTRVNGSMPFSGTGARHAYQAHVHEPETNRRGFNEETVTSEIDRSERVRRFRASDTGDRFYTCFKVDELQTAPASPSSAYNNVERS